MMAELGLLANVIAVVNLSAKIASSCYQYSCDVKGAKADIDRFKREVDSVTDLLWHVKALLEGPGKTSLSTENEIKNALAECEMQLQQLNTVLDPGRGRKAMSKFGVRALKWPFKSRDIDTAINSLGESRATISDALQVDQTAQIRDIHEKIDLSKLPFVESAAFDSYLEKKEPLCLPGTRNGLLSKITAWAENEHSTCIFWLRGMAGTGKSTISRTSAQAFDDKGQLGGSFFFKRGGDDRGKAPKFFTTIRNQLITKFPIITPFIRKAIDADPHISTKSLELQFKKLIIEPLSKIPSVALKSRTIILVVDALDECEGEADIEKIVGLLSTLGDVESVCMRVFVTSRPELPIRIGFQSISQATYKDLVLHEISEATVKHDISLFFQSEFAKIRFTRSLNSDWPGEVNITALVDMASPLFISAATVCRFVGDHRWPPQDRLAIILEYQAQIWASKFDATYQPILQQLFNGLDRVEKLELATKFQQIVGTIVILASPLSVASLANLLGIEESQVTCILDSLHSVLSIPTSQAQPVRLLHLSFRDFLLDHQKRGSSPFWVDEKKTHKR